MKRLFAVGDIHGCFDSLKQLMEDVIQIQKSDQIVFLGDYIDRGPKVKEVIDYILYLKEEGFDIITLMGNHEKMLLDAFWEDRNIPLWLFNGGGETLKSFGLEATVGLSNKYWNFFKELLLYYCYEDFVFVHAGFSDKIENPFQDTYQMLWIRNETYTNPLLKGKTIIHGHTPITFQKCQYSVKACNTVINIDTGCVFKSRPGCGKLTAVELFSKKLYSV